MTERLTARPQLQQSTRAPQETVAARQGDYLTHLPQGGGEMDGFLRGLSALNPALNSFTNAAHKREQEADHAAGAAFGQRVENPAEALSGAPLQAPVDAPPAMSLTFRKSMNEALAQRAGIQTKAALVAQYEEHKQNPDFDVKGWLLQERGKALQGITDPTTQAAMGAHLMELEANILSDANRRAAARAEEVRKTTLDAEAGDAFTANMTADQMAEQWPAFLARQREKGFSGAEVAQGVLQRIAHASAKAGGMPELFDLFDRKGPDGVPIGGGPLLAQVQQARQQALSQREKAIHDATETARAGLYKGISERIGTDKLTWQELVGHIGPHGLTAKEAAAYWDKHTSALADAAGAGALEGLAAQGLLWTLPASQQTKYLEHAGKEIVGAWAQARSPEEVAAVGARILQMHATTKASIPMDVVARRVKAAVSNLPNASGPGADFLGMAELYKALSADPAVRDRYFDESTDKVMRAFTNATGSGEDPATAYVGAYRHTDPAYIKAAEEYKRSPEYAKVVKEDFAKYISGSSKWLAPSTWGDNAQNGAVVSTWAREALVKFRAENPWASQEDVEAHLKRTVERNWVLDKTTGLAVQISPTESAGAQQEAISAFTAQLSKEHALDTLPGDWKIVMLRNGDQGAYSVYKASGSGKTLLADVHMRDIMLRHSAKTTLSDAERAEVGRAQLKLRKGESLADADLAALSKARGLGFLKGTDLEKVQDFEKRAFSDRMAAVPQMLLDGDTSTSLQLPARAGRVDYGTTARIAAGFLNPATRNLAASLVTLGEAAMPTAYADPAKGAGKNIGMGYNLQANAKTVNEDLRRAGVPAERIEDVKDGKASLSDTQMQKLLALTLPRYEKSAKATAEETSPGLWGRMTEAQRAVMVDIAYQVGSTDQFKKAWQALAKGDMAAFKREATVTYVGHDGVRRPDNRRNRLRADLLAGTARWDAVIQQTGKLPSNKLDALSLNQR